MDSHTLTYYALYFGMNLHSLCNRPPPLLLQTHFPQGQAARGIFCSRTVNLRSITTIGYDMDYTLIHYNVRQWEGRAYEYGMDNLRRQGYPVEGLEFDPDLVKSSSAY
jgi:hypothetical protein